MLHCKQGKSYGGGLKKKKNSVIFDGLSFDQETNLMEQAAQTV